MKVSNKNVGANASTLGGAAAAEKSKTDKVSIGSAGAQKPKSVLSSAELESSAKVNLSSRAQDMKKAKEIASSTPDVDEAKVAKFQQMIDSGTYKINPAGIADKMVDEELKLL